MLPVPTLDHVVVNVRERMDDAAALYRRLGFALTPLGRHTLGSINHLAMFGTDYMELLGVPPGEGGRKWAHEIERLFRAIPPRLEEPGELEEIEVVFE